MVSKKKLNDWIVPAGQPLTDMDRRILEARSRGKLVPTREMIKTPKQIEGIRRAGVLNTAVLDAVAESIRPGMTTMEIDRIVYDYTTKHGGIPAPLNYEGFPNSCCTSVNVAPVSTMLSVMAYPLRTKCLSLVTSSMLTARQFLTDTTPMQAECLWLAEKQNRVGKSLWTWRGSA